VIGVDVIDLLIVHLLHAREATRQTSVVDAGRLTADNEPRHLPTEFKTSRHSNVPSGRIAAANEPEPTIVLAKCAVLY